MSFDKLVVNASPIISLAKIGCADFLLKLSSELIIPQGVFEEITACPYSDEAVLWVRRQNPECIRSVEIPLVISGWNLGKGESQVIAYAYQQQGCVISVDDKPAKKCAELFGIKVNGTLALLIRAKQAGLISEVKTRLFALKANGFRVSSSVFKAALRLAGED